MNRDELIQKALSRVKQASGKLYKNFTDNEGTFQQGRLMPARNFVRSQPVQQAYNQVSSIPLVGQFARKPVQFAQATARFADPRQTRNALSSQGISRYSDAVRQGVDTAATFYGGAKMAVAPIKQTAMAVAANAGFGAGVNSLMAEKGQKMRAAIEGAKSGMDFAPYSGILGKTNMARTAITKNAISGISNPLVKFGAKRGADMASNVVEGMGLNTIQGRNPFDLQGILIDSVAGGVIPTGMKVKGASAEPTSRGKANYLPNSERYVSTPGKFEMTVLDKNRNVVKRYEYDSDLMAKAQIGKIKGTLGDGQVLTPIRDITPENFNPSTFGEGIQMGIQAKAQGALEKVGPLGPQGKLTVYRGGRDMGDSRILTPAKQNSGALFFTESEKYAKQYSTTPDQVSGLYKTDIRTDKIFDITNPQHIKQLEKHIHPQALQSMKDATSHDAVDWATASQYIDEIEEAGFKGAKFLERPAENITQLADGSYKLEGKPVYSYALFDKEVPMTRAYSKSSPQEANQVSQSFELPDNAMGFAGEQRPRVTIQGPKGSRMMVGPKDAVKVPPTSGIGKIGETPVNDRVQSAKEYVNKLYTETIDRYNPLSRAAKGTKQEKAMRYALSQNYGAGSTGTYHVDYELSPILKSVDENDLKDFVIAQRDIELAGRGIKGSDAGEAQKIVSKLNQKYGGNMQPLNDAANKLYDYQSKMVKEYLVDTGVMSQEGYNAMVSSNQKYVPFKRIMDEMDDFLGAAPQKKGVGSVGSQGVVMKIKGSDRQIVDPLQSIIENTYKIVALGRRNQVAGTIASLADEYPDMVKPFDGEVGLKPVISVMRDGKAQKFLVPKDVAEAAKGLNEESLNAVIKILSIPTQVLRATATGYNPEFQAPNVVRDLQSAFVNVGLNPLRFAQGMAHLVKQDEVYQEFLKAGGKTSTIMLDRPELIKKVAQITKPKSHLITHPRDIWEALRTMGELSEQPTRIAVYEKTLKNALKNGIPREEAMKEAAYQAQEATVNFARRGSKTQAANALIAFINARTQGTDRLLRTMKNNPKSGLMRLALISQVPAVALYAWNRTFPEYNDERFVTEYDKRDNFIFMLPEGMPGGTRYLKLPKAEIGKFANPTEAFLSYADGKDSNIVDEMVRSFSNLSPVSSPGDLIPTAIRPPIENLSNYSFFTKREIVPEYKKEYPKPYQYTSATPSMYREAGAETDQSPAMLQNLTEGYTTGFGKMAAGAYEALAPDKLKTKAPYSGAPINNTPVLRRFAGGEKRTEEEQQLMDERAANSISFQIKDVKAGIKRGDIPEAEGARRINELEGKKQEAEKKLMTMGIGGNKVELPKDTGKPTFESKPEDPKNIVEKISLAAKGIGVDPGNTIKAIFTEEEMRKIEGNALILKRKERLNTLGDKNLQIDHKVSLGMGGDNSIDNLQVMTVDQKAQKDKLEKRLIRDLQSGKITRQEAQKQIQDFTKNNPAGVPLSQFDKSKQSELLKNSPTIDAKSIDEKSIAKIKARISDEDRTLLNEDVRQYYLRDIDLTDNTNRYTKAIDEKKVWNRLGEVEKNDKLTANQKKGVVNGILKKIGVSENDYEYYKIARESTDLKTLAVYDKIEKLGNDRKAVFEYLIKGRRDVNGQTLISKGVLDNMVEDGTITKEERKLIEKFSFKDGKPRVKVSGRGKKAKLKKISITVPKIRARYSGGGKLGQTLQSKGTSPIKMARLRVRPAQSTQQSTKLPQIYQTNPKL